MAIPSHFRPGDLLLGRFKVIRLLGSGGMGEVYEATDLQLGRVALKTIRADIAAAPEVLSRFKKEVQLSRKVSSPHICRVHELFVAPGLQADLQCLFLTMEFLDGVTLAEKLSQSGLLPWHEVRDIGFQICSGLQAIHHAGIIHRDLKTRNVMLASRNGAACAVVMDFGLAREFSSASSETTSFVTKPGAVTGTPAYMAPEQFEGSEATPATDVYALGIILYELLTGKHPFAASTTVGAAVSRGRRPQPASTVQPGVPARFDATIGKCLEYEPHLRYQTAEEVAAALNNEKPQQRAQPSSQRLPANRLVISLAAASFLLLLLTAGTIWFWSHRYHPPSRDVLRLYNRGTDDLRAGTFYTAVNDLQAAVQRDPHFVLGHTRLADAWNELDFEGKASQEMLLASGAEFANLPALDRLYVQAVHATLVRDFQAAVGQYEAILKDLPEQEKSHGQVDLGRAHEKAGDVSAAIKNYESAAQLDKDNPAPLVRLGILYSHQQDSNRAETAFRQAEVLYKQATNMEGVAEIAYQRGYAANERADAQQARANLQSALHKAQDIDSKQLEIRALTQLSSVESNAGNSELAIKYANDAIQLAQENQLQSWSGDGLMRLGNAYLSVGKLQESESALQNALRVAQQLQQPRIMAAAQLGIASVRDQQQKWDESARFARDARDYYQSHGMRHEEADSTDLLVRAQEGNKDLVGALQSAQVLYDSAKKSSSPSLMQKPEELLGGVLYDLERYPEALSHYQSALDIAATTHENENYHVLQCADVLRQLGRYAEAQDLLRRVATKSMPELVSSAELLQAQILLSQNRFGEVITAANRALASSGSKAVADDLPQFRMLRARAELNLGSLNSASQDISKLADWATADPDGDSVYDVKMLQAEFLRKSGSAESAESAVIPAIAYFTNLEKKESLWHALFEQAKILRTAGKIKESKDSAKQALDIVHSFAQTWPADYRSYISRPDINAALKELSSLAHI